MLTRGLRVDVEFNLPSSQTVAFNMNVWLNFVCLNAPLDTLCTVGLCSTPGAQDCEFIWYSAFSL